MLVRNTCSISQWFWLLDCGCICSCRSPRSSWKCLGRLYKETVPRYTLSLKCKLTSLPSNLTLDSSQVSSFKVWVSSWFFKIENQGWSLQKHLARTCCNADERSNSHVNTHIFNTFKIVFVIIHNSIFRALDDVYLLSAAMQCGPGTLLVSSDMFSNHLQGMESLMKAQFTRWQELYQVKLASFVGEQPLFEVCTSFRGVYSEPCFNLTVAEFASVPA